MKTLKTISSAFAVTLLVSAVSAPAMETVSNLFSSARDAVVSAGKTVAAKSVNAVKATDKALFGQFVGANELKLEGGLPIFRNLRANSALGRAAVVAAIAAIPVAAYKTYTYFTAEEATEDEGDVAQKSTPVEDAAPQEEPAVTAPVEEAPVVSAPVEEAPVVSAPAQEAKPVRNPKIGARGKTKAPRAKVSANGDARRHCSGKRTVKQNAGSAKRTVKQNAGSAKRTVKRNADCKKNGNCGVRRSK